MFVENFPVGVDSVKEFKAKKERGLGFLWCNKRMRLSLAGVAITGRASVSFGRPEAKSSWGLIQQRCAGSD
jgi:hypothetical protein